MQVWQIHGEMFTDTQLYILLLNLADMLFTLTM
jgi:hypothetical protein